MGSISQDGQMATHFAIPSDVASQLRAVQLKDTRSDDKILASLREHVPVTSEKNIWAFWDKGIDKMPAWCQRNVCDWVRICGHGDKPWTVRVLDAIPDSPNYALKFLDGSTLPQSFVDGQMQGPYVGPHSADFLRGALLYEYGGANMDVGCILFRNLDRVGWESLEDPTSPYQIALPNMYGSQIANHFVMARKGDPFIKRWQELFVHLWRGGRREHKGIIADPLLAFALDPTVEDFSVSIEKGFKWSFTVDPQTVFEYISQVLAWNRLTRLEATASDPFSATEYWQQHVLCLDSLQECWGAEPIVDFQGEELYRLLTIRLDAEPSSEDYKQAHKLVWRLLTRSTLQKITHGKHLTSDKHLGVLWDENPEAHVKEGTFAELLRYGSTHFEQTRTSVALLKAEKPNVTFKKGLLEP